MSLYRAQGPARDCPARMWPPSDPCTDARSARQAVITQDSVCGFLTHVMCQNNHAGFRCGDSVSDPACGVEVSDCHHDPRSVWHGGSERDGSTTGRCEKSGFSAEDEVMTMRRFPKTKTKARAGGLPLAFRRFNP